MRQVITHGRIFVLFSLIISAQDFLCAQHLPAVIQECEVGTTYCGTWTLDKSSLGNPSIVPAYIARWDNGAVAIISVKTFTPQSVFLYRDDTAESVSAGLTATYKASIFGQAVQDSEVTWTWPGHAGYPATGDWYAIWTNNKSLDDIDTWLSMKRIFELGALNMGIYKQGCAILGPAAKACVEYFAAFEMAYEMLAMHYEALIVDPPDHNFRTLAAPSPPSVPRLEGKGGFPNKVWESANALLAAQRQELGFLAAIKTSNERAFGALQGKDNLWQRRHTEAAMSYYVQLAELTRRQLALQSAVQKTWKNARLPEVGVTVKDVRALQLRLRTSGFSPQHIQFFSQLGLATAEISKLKEDLLALDPGQAAAMGSFPSSLGTFSFINSLNKTAQSFASIALPVARAFDYRQGSH